jgi:hypothetical protein
MTLCRSRGATRFEKQGLSRSPAYRQENKSISPSDADLGAREQEIGATRRVAAHPRLLH